MLTSSKNSVSRDQQNGKLHDEVGMDKLKEVRLSHHTGRTAAGATLTTHLL